MLPSTGYFKGIDCPFLESGLCERPHCHFRHCRREPQAQQLVLEVVREALQRRSDADPGAIDGLISDVVRRLTPSIAQSDTKAAAAAAPAPTPAPALAPDVKPTYNPTPIAVLNQQQAAVNPPPRRHIPVPYTPLRPLRLQPHQPRPSYVPSSSTYTPQGAKPSGMAYEPGAAPPDASAAYTPEDTGYAPSESQPSNTVDSSERYKPTPLPQKTPSPPSPSPSSSSEEPLSKKPKIDIPSVPSPPLVAIPDMDTEFKILDEIIADEKRQETQKKTEKIEKKQDKPSSNNTKKKSEHERRHSDSERKSSRDKHSSKSEKSDRSSKDKRESKSAHDRRSSKNERSKSSSDHKSDRKSDKSKNSKSKEKRSESKLNKQKQVEQELIFKVEDDYLELYDSDSDEETIAEECLKIFEEYVPTVKSTQSKKTAPQTTSIKDEDLTLGKKRVAHATNEEIRRPAPTKAAPDHRARAAQAMAERYARAKQNLEAKLKLTSQTETLFTTPPASSSSKIRIAHVPNVSSFLDAKKSLPKPKESQPQQRTITQTISKGATRIAHVPDEKFCNRPSVLEPLSSKIPVNVRTKYLNMMIDVCLKTYLTAEDAYERALREELATCKKCNSVPIYKNSAVLAVSRLKKETLEDGSKNSITNGLNTISHSKILDGKLGEKCSWSIVNKYKKENQCQEEFKGIKFYENIARWKLTEEELKENGFPRPHPDDSEKGRAKIYIKNTKQKPPKGNIRTCRRCNKEYTVDKKGFPVSQEECIYHPNNKYRFRGEVKYQCCGQDGMSDGCLSASCHVYEYIDYDNLRGYVRTLPKNDTDESFDYGVYALDCEMCYTTNGLDLTRVTVIDSSCKVVYETLVKPIFPIIDYNTRYSGLTEENMSKCTTTLLEVQATFLHMFSDKTILVGHSLESDFKALKLIHDTVVDTSVLFPHKMGPPYKRALRNLSSEYLKKIIQNAEGNEGHDSAEDALVCMELLIWKLKEELKIR